MRGRYKEVVRETFRAYIERKADEQRGTE